MTRSAPAPLVLAAAIDLARAAAFPEGAALAMAPRPVRFAMADDRARAGDTTSLSVVDADGNAVAVTTTVGGGFGTSLVMGDTGLLFNNGLRLGSTSPYPGHPNHVAPGQRALLGNGPTIVLEQGRLKYAFGSPGGETIGQTQFQFLVHALDLGLPVQAAVEAPRFALDAEPNFYRPGAAISVQAESRFAPEVLSALTAMGHKVERVGPWSVGSVQAIHRNPTGTMTSGSDPRRMGYAVGY
jgi:gamma-glutamyltranspeptidase/glutathione hydrolase